MMNPHFFISSRGGHGTFMIELSGILNSVLGNFQGVNFEVLLTFTLEICNCMRHDKHI